MADGGQRLLDVIDDPNALESFLGGLVTADTELLPSAETVDNVVASLARSLDDNEYEVDSPNETLFDTLDSSSNHLTDISRSYVPSDFDHVGVQNDGFSNNLDGFSNGNNVIRGNLAQHEQQQQQQTHVQTSGCDQFIGSSSNNNNNSTIINSVISASSGNTTNNTTVTGSTLKQIIASSVPNCDPSNKSTPNFVQAGQQLQLTQNSVSSASSNNLNFVFSSQQDLQQQHHNKQIEVSHNQLNQVTSLSSVSLEGHQLQQNAQSNSTNNLISVVGSGHENGSGSTLTNNTSGGFQGVTNQQQSKAQQHVSASDVSQTINAVATSGAGGVPNTAVSSSGANTVASGNVTLSTSTNVVGSNLASIQQQQQYLAQTSTHQLMTGQTVNIPGMTVSAPQLIANSQGGLVASTGQNILQQIQSAGGGQSYIAMEQPTALIATGPTTFGTNVALLSTGGTPTYAVLPTTPQFLTNAIIPQPTIQTLTKAANGAYYQTTGTPQIVATSTVNALQNVGTSSVTTSNTGTPPVTSVSSSTEASSSGGSQQSMPTSSAPNASTTISDGVMTQLIQQSQQQQQSFTIGNAGSLGQVVVSQVSSLGTMTTPQQAHQLAGTIVVNQYGQPMLLPTASTAQAGLQLILRQQPTQPQVLTLQTPQGTQAGTAASGKPIVRYVSQMPQLAQTSGYGLQQIQTANGPTWVAVRYPQASQASQFSQIQTDSIISAASTIQSQITNSGQSHQLQLQAQQSQQVQIQLQQQQQQLIQQAQQQQQIQLQNSLSTQQQVQVTNQNQMQSQQQQQMSFQPQQVQLQHQQGQLSNVQQQVQSQQLHNHQQTSSQAPTPMETQNISTPTQQNQFINRSNQMHQTLNNNSPQTPSRDVEQQQISVPDSSSEPPPPKKAKTKSKSSKKKVTLDLEQLLKQSGIMDEDLQDDMSFDFGFGSMMDTQPNGLPPSPQVPPPAQIPVINTTETPKKASKKKSNKKSPAQPPPPIPVVLPPPPIATPSPSAKKKRSPPKKKNAPPPPCTPPPPLPPPPPIVTPTKSKSSKKKSSNSSGNVNENQKSEPPPPKTASSKKNVPPKKVSSLDTLLATIDAVAAAAGASYASSQSSPSSFPPPSPTITPSQQPTPSPSPKSKSKSKSKAKKSEPTTPSSKVENLPPPVPNSTYPVPSSTTSQSVLPPSSLSFPQSQTSLPNHVVAPTLNTSIAAPPPSISPTIPTSRATGTNLTNGSTSVTTSQTGLTRIVQTIQLTPQNQQLLRNIQGEIQRLFAIPARTDSEQAALQKLINLQQQVIATGTPVPNPTHLNNLAQIVNVDSISLATPSATVPSSDTASASSSSSTSIPLVFPCESDLNPSPVSSTVVATTATSVLANSNLITASSKLISSKLSGNNGSSPVAASTAGGGGGSSSNNGAGIIVGSPSVSSTASPDSTSNLASNLNVEQCNVLPSTITTTTSATNNPTPNVNSGGMGMGNIVVSNVKTELGQLVASYSVAPSEDKTKENTQTKSFQGVTPTSTPVPVPTQSSVSFSQHLQHVPPPPSSYAPPTFTTRPVLDEKKAEEQRQANLKAEEEKRARWKKEEFEMLLQRDQQYVVKPDYEVPFSSKKDAVERLMKYHIYRDRNDMDFEEFDAEFGNNAGILLEKFSVMMSKYRNLLLKESTKEVGCAERVMLERMFVSEEKLRMEQDRLLIAQGDVLELPPPPESWVPKIKEMVDKEMVEFEPQDPVVSQQVQSAVDSIIGCGNNDASSYLLEEGDKIEYDAFGVPINSSGYAGLAASSADIDEAVRSILS